MPNLFAQSRFKQQAKKGGKYGSEFVKYRLREHRGFGSGRCHRVTEFRSDETAQIDATHGRRTRSIIVMDSNHVVLSAIQAETVSQRYNLQRESN